MNGAPGIYVHVPFCARVCPYCDFAVRTGGPRTRARYVDALRTEIDLWGTRIAAGASAPGEWSARQSFDTVFIGGGTPSVLTSAELVDILATVSARLPVADPFVTLEANPEDVDAERLAAWRQAGVDRISLGVQSFDDDVLATLGRVHNAATAVAAVEQTMAAGFDVVSLDLIYAVPGQSPRAWADTLRQATRLAPQHISCYELTVHEGTPFHRRRESGTFAEVEADARADLFFSTHRLLAEAGYPAYEVSNFAREDRWRSRHNRKYWENAPYLGLGPSAHSFDGVRTRWWNERALDDWSRAIGEGQPPVDAHEVLRVDQRALEALALGLRTAAGVDLRAVEQRLGIELRAPNAALIDDLTADGLLHDSDAAGAIAPTLEGMAQADGIAARFAVGGRAESE